MDFKTSQNILSKARIGKYAAACAGDKMKTMQLYRYNLRLCQRFYGVLSLFEVVLRNAINRHYQTYFADTDWIVHQAAMGKLLANCKDEINQLELDYYLDLTHIREFRNRIAHHEPICFDGSGHINTTFARTHYQLICDYIFYLGHPSDDVVSWAEKPDSILNLIDKMTP